MNVLWTKGVNDDFKEIQGRSIMLYKRVSNESSLANSSNSSLLPENSWLHQSDEDKDPLVIIVCLYDEV
jgi:hypothetical protein